MVASREPTVESNIANQLVWNSRGGQPNGAGSQQTSTVDTEDSTNSLQDHQLIHLQPKHLEDGETSRDQTESTKGFAMGLLDVYILTGAAMSVFFISCIGFALLRRGQRF